MQPLDEWAAARQATRAETAEALMHIVGAVMALHSAGLVHRGLRPGAALWQASQQKWVIVGYADAALNGAPGHCIWLLRAAVERSNDPDLAGQRMALDAQASLAYEAPETVQARVEGRATVVADRTVDVWALGVICYETLTQTQLFSPAADVQEMAAAFAGHALPWENPTPNAAQLGKLGVMREGVLLMLDRDPERRPRLSVLFQIWRRLMLKAVVERRTGRLRA